MTNLQNRMSHPCRSLVSGLLALGLAAAASPALAQGSFALTGSMHTGRDTHSAALLANGEVLVAGGENTAGGILASAELYDPTTGAWSVTGNMTLARRVHTETLLPNGEVLVAGGFTPAGCTASAELYNPATGSWSATGSMPMARGGAVATLLQDGTVLLVGGGCGGVGDNIALLYDPATGKWSQAASMHVARLFPAAVLLPDGVVLVAGGFPSNGATELYVDGQWQLTTRMIIDVQSVVGVLLGNDDVLVFGGYPLTSENTEFYDPVTATWTMANGAPVISGPLTALADGSAFIAGGVTHYKTPSRGAFVFTGRPVTVPNGTGTITIYPWSTGGIMNIARGVHTATLLANGQVLVAGGFTAGTTTAQHLASITATPELYTP